MNKTDGKKENKVAAVSFKKEIGKSILDFLKQGIEKEVFDEVIIPMKVPAGDSFAYVLIRDKKFIDDGIFLSPVMPVQGGKMVSSVTRLGSNDTTTAVIMRPCEMRATIELSKVGQTNLENLVLISMDCPGVMPISDYLKDPEKQLKKFNESANKLDDCIMRPVCKICDKSSMIAGDLHIGTLGAKKDSFYLISNSEKGNSVIEKMGLKEDNSINSWKEKVKKISEEKKEKRIKKNKELKNKIGGIDKLTEAFSKCINCHNCMSVCPVCFCRLCYFESDKVKQPSDDYLARAKNKGSIRFLPDTTLFHMGRMTHMSLSCVSCGACEDACPVDIPVAQIFCMISDETQKLFDYISGRSPDEPIPLVAYKEEELVEMEDSND